LSGATRCAVRIDAVLVEPLRRLPDTSKSRQRLTRLPVQPGGDSDVACLAWGRGDRCRVPSRDHLSTVAASNGLPMGTAYGSARPLWVNVVVRGILETEGEQAAMGDDRSAFLAMTPLNRVGRPDEVGKATAYLASSDAAFVTGAFLAVDGGSWGGAPLGMRLKYPGSELADLNVVCRVGFANPRGHTIRVPRPHRTGRMARAQRPTAPDHFAQRLPNELVGQANQIPLRIIVVPWFSDPTRIRPAVHDVIADPIPVIGILLPAPLKHQAHSGRPLEINDDPTQIDIWRVGPNHG
jgi:hypothetical protein